MQHNDTIPATEFVIRDFSLAFLDEVLRVENRSFAVDTYPASKFTWFHAREPDGFLVTLIDGKVVGYIAGFMDGGNGYLDSIATEPEYRRKSLGTALVRAFMERFRAKGAKSLTLHVRTTNDVAIRLYKKLGFAVENTTPGYYSDGSPAFYMRLCFNYGQHEGEKEVH